MQAFWAIQPYLEYDWFPKPPMQHLRSQASGKFSKAGRLGPCSVAFRSADLQPWTISWGSLGARDEEETYTSSLERQAGGSQKERQAWWSLGTGSVWRGWEEKTLFLTVPLGDSYHGYKSIFGACHCQLNIKSRLFLSHHHKKIHTHGRWWLTASSGLLPEWCLLQGAHPGF